MPSSTAAIIPTYNRAAMLRECIESLLKQSRPLQQIIIVNDGSTDNTESIVQAFGDRVMLVNKANGGKASAINVGLTHCQSDYVWICDDDDIAAADGLEYLASALDADDTAGFSYGTFKIFRDTKAGRIYTPPTYWLREGEPDIHLQFLEEMFTFQYAMLVRRSLYEKLGPFREDLIRSQDHEMAIRLARSAKAVYVPEVIFFQRAHEAQRGTQAGSFAARANAQKWLEYGQTIITGIRENYRLEEFTPTFARNWDAPLAKRAALLERACISAERAMWPEAIEDLRQAASLSPSPARPEEIGLAEAVIRQALPWRILADNSGWIDSLGACYRANAYGRDILHAACRPLVWHARKMLQKGDIAGGIGMLKLMASILGMGGMCSRLVGSVQKRT